MTITVTEDGPYIVRGGVPLTSEEIFYDDDGDCRAYRETKTHPPRQQYALCRCGRSTNRPFCDGTHAGTGFDGTEAGDREPFLEGAEITRGPSLTLADNRHLCGHAGFCHRAGGIWSLVKFSDPGSRETAVEEACNCAPGRLVVYDNATGEAIERPYERSVAVIEDPVAGQDGPLWVRGGVPVIGADGAQYEVRNRVALCRCGRSKNKPFCDGRHLR
jgi:CDGSH-type Zn-finger protein